MIIAEKKISEKARATRERIIIAATELFYLQGYNATGLDKVLKAAGVTKGNFYYHFKSKEALAIATLDWEFDLVSKDMQEKVFSSKAGDSKQSPLNTLFSLLELLANKQKEQYSNGHVRGCYFGNFTLELSTASQAVRDKVSNIFKQYLELIESLLVQAQNLGEISKVINPSEISPVILGQVEGAILLDKANQKPQAFDTSIKFIKQFLKA